MSNPYRSPQHTSKPLLARRLVMLVVTVLAAVVLALFAVNLVPLLWQQVAHLQDFETLKAVGGFLAWFVR